MSWAVSANISTISDNRKKIGKGKKLYKLISRFDMESVCVKGLNMFGGEFYAISDELE